MVAQAPSLNQEQSYALLSKTECLFAAIWHNPQGVVSTKDIAQYYQTEVKAINEFLIQHWEEFKQELVIQDSGEYEWTPRSAIRLGMLLDSPVAIEVRTLALNVIEAHKKKDLRSSVAFLLENARFVEWSDRSIAEILKCSPTTVGKVRKELESNNKVVKFERRKHTRNGKTVERENKDSSPLMSSSGHEEGSNTDSSVVSPTAKVKVTSQSSPFYGQEGEVVGDPENKMHLFVKFPSSENSELIPIKDLDAPSTPIERRYPKEYTEAIAQLKQQHETEKAQLEEEIRIRLEVEAETRAARKVQEQLAAVQAIASAIKADNIKLQQEVDRLKALQRLEDENQQLQQRIGELERALEQKPQEWGNTFTKQAEKVLNAEVKAALSYDLRAIAAEPPVDKAEECLQLMGLALKGIAIAINHAQALEAAAILLGEVSSQLSVVSCQSSDISSQISVVSRKETTVPSPQSPIPNPQSPLPPIPTVTEALIQIKSVLINPDCTWPEFWAVVEPFQAIKEEYWRELSKEEKTLIRQLKENSETVKVGSRVSHSDPYNTLYKIQGTVTGFESGMFLVHWDTVERPLFQHRYEVSELRLV